MIGGADIGVMIPAFAPARQRRVCSLLPHAGAKPGQLRLLLQGRFGAARAALPNLRDELSPQAAVGLKVVA